MAMERETEVAAMVTEYRNIIKPGLEWRREELDPVRNPVEVVLLDAYMELMDTAVFGNSVGDAARKEIQEIEELAPLVNPSRNIDACTAHGRALTEMMHSAGMGIREVYETIEQGRKRNKGRPVAVSAIKALEMDLAGKSANEIADVLCDYTVNPPHKPGEQRLPHRPGGYCSDRYRKEIEKLRPLYEKHKARK